MPDQPAPLPGTLNERRERVVQALTKHFANDHLDTVAFEERLDRVYAARTVGELESLLSDLPALPGTAEPAGRQLARPEDVQPRQYVVAIMGGATRKGGWTPARRIEVVAIMGGVELDFREARFASGVTEVNVITMMGGVEVIVPPDIRVECQGMGLLGEFEGVDQEGMGGPGRSTLRITGVAIMGGVETSVRLPGESLKDARKRVRAEQQQKPGKR